MKENTINVIILIGAGAIGIAIARRISIAKTILVADQSQESLDKAVQILTDAGYTVSQTLVDISSQVSVQALSQKASQLGSINGLILSAGVSPSQASPEMILKVDLYGTAIVLEEFGQTIAHGGAAVVIASQSGHRLPPLSVEQNNLLATTPTNQLLALEMLQPANIKDALHAYQISKRGNSLHVMAEAVRWGKRSARVNTISPGIIITPLANDELNGPRGQMYKSMIKNSPAGRAGTADEVATVAALLMGEDGGFITGSDFLMDGGATAAFWHNQQSSK